MKRNDLSHKITDSDEFKPVAPDEFIAFYRIVLPDELCLNAMELITFWGWEEKEASNSGVIRKPPHGLAAKTAKADVNPVFAIPLSFEGNLVDLGYIRPK